MTPDERLWYLRNQLRWPLRRIAKWLEVDISTVYRRLVRLQRSRGLRPTPTRFPKARSRTVRPISLSGVFDV